MSIDIKRGAGPVVDALPDELQKAFEGKFVALTLGGKTIQLKRWGIRPGIRNLARIGALFKQIAPALANPEDLTAWLRMDLEKLVAQHLDSLIDLLADSVQPGNFETLAAAKDWIEQDLELAEATALLGAIIRQNKDPLAKSPHVLSAAIGLQKGNGQAQVPSRT
jgi:hypothetical protein